MIFEDVKGAILMKRYITLLITLQVIILFGACTSMQVPQEIAAPVIQPDFIADANPVIKPSDGSLWHDNISSVSRTNLYGDYKARIVGDILTIQIVESSSAKNNADTKTDRGSSIGAGVGAFLGAQNRYSPDASFNPFGEIRGYMDSEHKGSGTTSRSGNLKAYISTRVVEVLPGGSLRIFGSREVTINHEKQIISITGIVRPKDISYENVVLSTYVADAKILYSGVGVVNDKQQPGWFHRVMDAVWPF